MRYLAFVLLVGLAGCRDSEAQYIPRQYCAKAARSFCCGDVPLVIEERITDLGGLQLVFSNPLGETTTTPRYCSWRSLVFNPWLAKTPAHREAK